VENLTEIYIWRANCILQRFLVSCKNFNIGTSTQLKCQALGLVFQSLLICFLCLLPLKQYYRLKLEYHNNLWYSKSNWLEKDSKYQTKPFLLCRYVGTYVST
jgi:hypothetical protein